MIAKLDKEDLQGEWRLGDEGGGGLETCLRESV